MIACNLQPVRLPTLPKKCPYNYTVESGDTYCKISSRVGISVPRLQANNPKIGVFNVTPGEQFRIPCKPEINCCPTFITAAAEGTGKLLVSKLSSFHYMSPSQRDLQTFSPKSCWQSLLIYPAYR